MRWISGGLALGWPWCDSRDFLVHVHASVEPSLTAPHDGILEGTPKPSDSDSINSVGTTLLEKGCEDGHTGHMAS
jgi:hypothetical protein